MVEAHLLSEVETLPGRHLHPARRHGLLVRRNCRFLFRPQTTTDA